ncbi:MAG: hypothetical protein ACD_79C00650G0003 [uncultured bacterium]|nr:MAG: hypothetical protein ACD_79C00650G0003 [uncultured bacterium]
MEINVLTLFPEIVSGPLNQSILKRAIDKALVNINLVNIRDFAEGKHRQADDLSYGGGPGMVMKPEPIYKAVESVKSENSKIIMMSPSGVRFNQKLAKSLAGEEKLIFICGHYEGIDERINQIYDPLTISIGDYIITNGALAACVIIDAVVRLIPGVLGNSESAVNESFENGMLEYPQYTRPQKFLNLEVPEILLSGDHSKIAQWREEQARLKTQQLRDIQ